MNEFRKKSNLQRYNTLTKFSYAELHNQIKGHAVQFPTKFLCNESLKFPVYSKEYLCPEINFTWILCIYNVISINIFSLSD